MVGKLLTGPSSLSQNIILLLEKASDESCDLINPSDLALIKMQ